MKSLPLAAAALLLGTSALALTPSTEPSDAPAVAKDAYVPAAALPATEPADLARHEWTAGEPALHHNASAQSWDSAQAGAGDPDLDLAVDPEVEQASLTGMGGPEEPIGDAPALDTLAAADTSPRPAAQNYPACRPGPGDDNCIQLYEPGVRVALASWTQPTGGLAGGEAIAMGGPYEPVDDAAAAETAMAGDGVVDAGLGETPADEESVAI